MSDNLHLIQGKSPIGRRVRITVEGTVEAEIEQEGRFYLKENGWCFDLDAEKDSGVTLEWLDV